MTTNDPYVGHPISVCAYRLFDSLPYAVRAALREADHNFWNVNELHRKLKNGQSPNRVASFVRKKDAEDTANGYARRGIAPPSSSNSPIDLDFL